MHSRIDLSFLCYRILTLPPFTESSCDIVNKIDIVGKQNAIQALQLCAYCMKAPPTYRARIGEHAEPANVHSRSLGPASTDELSRRASWTCHYTFFTLPSLARSSKARRDAGASSFVASLSEFLASACRDLRALWERSTISHLSFPDQTN